MKTLLKSKLSLVTAVYWILLSYMISALIFWFIALNKQNRLIASIRLSELNKNNPNYSQDALNIRTAAYRKTFQFIGEGSTFLVLILIGAVFVFRATRRQIKISQQQQNFMMAVTHELKTPIAIAQLNLETLQKRQLDESKKQLLINNTLQEANRLNTLCNNILFAAQLDAGAYSTTKQELNLSDLIEGCVDDFKKRFTTKEIIEEIQPSIYINGESLLLQMMLNNLLDNANKYGDQGSAITVSLQQLENLIELKVADQGIGLLEKEKKKIFEKFYRVGEENTRKTKGTGLGLYLCKKIVQGHSGKIFVNDNKPRGTIFTIQFKTV